MNRTLLLGLCALLLAACPKPMPQPPTPDAGDGGPPPTACEAMCATLKKFQCPEATGSNETRCAPQCQKTQDNHRTDLKPLLVAKANSVGDIKALGSVECNLGDAGP